MHQLMSCYDPPYKIIMHATSKEGISVSSYILTREYDGTRLVVEASIIPANFYYKIMTKLFGWSTKYVFDDHYKKLKPYIEEEVKDW
ncbi:hypothetical protein AB3N04_04755 [Alkalihalophilus sp. As8PL]|uniref:Uncharacterized protein n=1 Tax=Alkalihalophilus sp. As8PL TaxID=3237103 RepID=A0AB39BVN0_9BACI